MCVSQKRTNLLSDYLLCSLILQNRISCPMDSKKKATSFPMTGVNLFGLVCSVDSVHY